MAQKGRGDSANFNMSVYIEAVVSRSIPVTQAAKRVPKDGGLAELIINVMVRETRWAHLATTTVARAAFRSEFRLQAVPV